MPVPPASSEPPVSPTSSAPAVPSAPAAGSAPHAPSAPPAAEATPGPASDPAAVADRLRASGCVFAEDEAALLIAEADSPAALDTMVERRVAGLPLEQVVGWAEFRGLRIAVGPGVFVPRRRTEFLVDRAVALAPRRPVVVDLCCGSGAVAAALGAALDGARLYAADVDPAAVRCARRNLPGADVREGDLYAALPARLRGSVDVLTANVPYVPTNDIPLLPQEARVHEPLVALDGGGDGLDLVRRVAAEAPLWLAPGGRLFIETSRRQASAAAGAFTRAGLMARVADAPEQEATVVIGRRPPRAPNTA